MLAAEREKTWSLIGELVEDMSVFDVFLYANDYHNLKAAVKLVCTGEEDFGIFISHGTVDYRAILDAVRQKEFGLLPEAMRAPAEEAYTALSQTRARPALRTSSSTAPRSKRSSAPGGRATVS